MPSVADAPRPLSDFSDDELQNLATSAPPLEHLSDEQLAGVAVKQGLMKPEEATAAVQENKRAEREPIADAIAGGMSATTGVPEFAAKALLTRGGRAGDVAAQVVTPIVGGILGTEVAPLVGTAGGGAAGAAAGDALAQTREYFRGERDTPSKGELIASTVAGGIPVGGPILKTAARVVATRAAQGAGIASVADVTRQIIDTGKVDWGSVGQNAAFGALFGGGAGGLEARATRKAVLGAIRKTPEFKDFEGSDSDLTAAVRAKMDAARPAAAEPRNVTPVRGETPTAAKPLAELSDQELIAAARQTEPAAPAAAEATPEGQHDIVGAPVNQVSPEEIATRPDLMQFKRIDEAASGVNAEDKLAGKWDPLKAGNLLLWEPQDPAAHGLTGDQKYIVANGHHRFEFGQRVDTPGYNAQIVREGEGYSAGDARTLAAEINIADGKGSIYDQAKFIRNTAATHGADETLATARRIGARGRKAAAIGTQAGDSTFDAFINEQLSSEHAEQIAAAAPGNDAAQRVGIKVAAAGGSPSEAANTVRAAIADTGGSAKQIDLFGADDTALQAMAAQGKAASQFQRQVQEDIRAIQGAARKPEVAAKYGVDVKDPQALAAKLEDLKVQQARWDNWHGDPDLRAQVRAAAGLAPAPIAEPAAPIPATFAPKTAGADLFGEADKSFNLASEETPMAEAPAELPDNSMDLFAPEETRSTAPTALDKANQAARETAAGLAGQFEMHSMGGGRARPARSAAPEKKPKGLAPAPVAQPNAIVRDLQRIQANVAPQTLSAPARFAGNLLRELNAKMANELARADHALRPFRNDFDRTPVPKGWKYDAKQPLPRNLAFIDAYEGGRASSLPVGERAVATEFARQNSALVDRVQALGTGALKTFYENYFPHLWKDPVKAGQVMAALLSKSPLEGSKSFLKQRTHKLFIDGLAAGLDPVHDNPVDLWLLKQREVERYILGQNFVGDLKKAGLLKFVHAFSKAPEGWATVNDRAFTVYGPPTVTIKEAFDAGMREKTLQALDKLGVPHERLVAIGGKRWGYETNQKDAPGTERIVTKFGGPESVYWHEMGHALDSRYPELRSTVMAAKDMKDELRALADLRAEGQQVTQSFKSYLRSTPEKMAVILEAYLHAPERMQAVAPNVTAAFQGFMKAHPELSVIDDIRPTLRLGVGEAQLPVGGQVKLGNWYLPDTAARVVNNYLSPGLNPHLWYRSMREASNLVNSAQLSLSAFHLGFTSLDAATSRLALAIEDAARGDLGRAIGTAASVPFSPITNIMRGARLRSAVLAGAGENAELAHLVRSLEAAGGRIGQDAFWQTQFTRRMKRAYAAARQQLNDGQWLGGSLSGTAAMLQAPFALLEQTMRPILDYVVPRQKLGVFADMASREMERLGPNASPGDVREAMRKAWDSVDNRMGQVVYDNLFYNRAVKDVALLAFRAYGWQLGKYREGIGAMADTAAAVNQLRSGVRKTTPGSEGAQKEPLFTHRMAYALALPLLVGTIGGILHYMMTGKRPKGQDYFQPQTGESDRNGNPMRLNLPSYVKDTIAYGKHPITSFAHSTNPMFSAIFDLLENKDFYGVQIRNPDDPLWKQASEVAKWAASELVPFSVSGAAQMHQAGTPAWKQVAPFFGVTPVPARQNMTPAQELAAEIMSASLPTGAMTLHQFEAGKLLKDIVQQMKTGQAAAGIKAASSGIAAGSLNPNTAGLLVERLKYNPLQFQVHHLSAENAMRVWRISNDVEKQQLRGILGVKILNAETLSAAQKQTYISEIQSTLPRARAAAR